MSETDTPKIAEKPASALRFAILWFGIPLAIILVLAYFTRS